eukprot:TRINITY_DN29497_c0_g1_i1.p1 TRINITY_DN29497_c0_g1~~TRINITY_DN29497_c0_g1_i1.p1  ORF type:complete len:2184 (+),score=188.29 TRINITY_DN29497_c0_g1_i1:981-7532(+)
MGVLCLTYLALVLVLCSGTLGAQNTTNTTNANATSTPTATPTQTHTDTRTSTPSPSLSLTETRSRTRTASPTSTLTYSRSWRNTTRTSTTSLTPSPTLTPTTSPTLSHRANDTTLRNSTNSTASATVTPSCTGTKTRSDSGTVTLSGVRNETGTPTLSSSPTLSNTKNDTEGAIANASSNFSTGSTTASPSLTLTSTVTLTARLSMTATPTSSPRINHSNESLPLLTPSCTPTQTQTVAARGTPDLRVVLVLSGCSTNGAAASGCTSGTTLVFYGNGLSPSANITVDFKGGVGESPSCTVLASNWTILSCYLTLPKTSSGVWRTVVSVNGHVAAGNVTVDATPVPPVLSKVSGCLASLPSGEALGCEPGTVLTIEGSHFDTTTAATVTFSGGTGQAPSCTTLAVSSSTLVLCDSLSYSPGSTGVWSLELSSNGRVATNTLLIELPPLATSPFLGRVTGGCGVNEASALNCASGTLLTLTGAAFNHSVPSQNVLGFTAVETTTSANTVTCTVSLSSRSVIVCTLSFPAGLSGTYFVSLSVGGVPATSGVTISLLPRVPTIGSLLGCLGLAAGPPVVYQNCNSGTLLTVQGTGFDPFDIKRNVITLMPSASQAAAPSCRVRSANDSTLVCALVVASAGQYGLSVSVGYSASKEILLASLVPLTPPIVVGIYGCTADGVAAVNCSGGSTITVLGFHFDAVSPDANVVTFTGSSGSLVPSCSTIIVGPTNITCILTVPFGTNPGPWAAIVRVASVPSPSAVTATVLAASSPLLVSISGCAVSGETNVSSCANNTVITLFGKNFNSGSPSSNAVIFTATSGWPVPQCAVRDVNSTALRCFLVLPISNGRWEVTVAVNGITAPHSGLIVLAVPPSTLTSLAGCTTVRAAVYSCPDGSGLILLGDGLNTTGIAGTTVRLTGGSGSPQCTVTAANITGAVCTLAANGATGQWSLQVIVAGVPATGTLQLIIGSAAAPGLTAVLGCGASCSSGTVLSLLGSNFKTDASELVVVLTGDEPGEPPTCENVKAVNSGYLACTLFVPQATSGLWFVQVLCGAALSTGNHSITVVPLAAPTVTAISGCGDPPANSAAGCRTASAVTLNGNNFQKDATTVVFLPTGTTYGTPPSCQELVDVTPTSLICALVAPTAGGPWLVQVVVGKQLASGGIFLSVAAPAPPTVTTVNGNCTQSVGGTISCGPSGTITLIGTGFDAALSLGNIVYFVNTSNSAPSASPQCPVILANSTAVTCSLAVPQNAGGVWAVGVSVRGVLPQSTLPTLLLQGPTQTVAITALLGCDDTVIPIVCTGGKVLTITGTGFDKDTDNNVITFIGGSGTAPFCTSVATVTSGSGFSLRCVLSVRPVGVGGVWTVVLTTLGTHIAAGVITAAPPAVSVSAVYGCRTSGAAPFCIGGSTALIAGTNLPNDPQQLQVKFSASTAALGQPPTCGEVARVSPSVISCGLTVPAGTSGSWQLALVYSGLTLPLSETVVVTVDSLVYPELRAVSGCSYGCYNGVLLTLSGKGFDSGTPTNNLVDFWNGGQQTAPSCLVAAVSSHSLVCRFTAASATPATSWRVMLTVSGRLARNTALAIQTISGPTPTITGLSGCPTVAGVGYCTTSSVLTVVGHALELSSSLWLTRLASGVSRPLHWDVLSAGPTCTPLTTSWALHTCSFSVSQSQAGNWSVSASATSVQNTSLAVVLEAGPLPIIISISGCDNSTGTLVCTSGTLLGISASGVDPVVANNAVTFTQANGTAQPSCAVSALSTGLLQCGLYVPAGSSGTWSLTISASGGTSLPVLVQLRPAPVPVLLQYSGCNGSLCASGTTLTITGSGFDTYAPNGSSTKVFFLQGGNLTSTVRCDVNVVESSQSSVVCVLSASSSSAGSAYTMTVGPSILAAASERLVVSIAPSSTVLSAVVGCESSEDTASLICVDGGLLTVEGSGFDPSSADIEVVFSLGLGQSPTCRTLKATPVRISCRLSIPATSGGTWNLRLRMAGIIYESGLYVDLKPDTVPLILAVASGCSNNGVTAAGCTNGATLRLSGTNLVNDSRIAFLPIGGLGSGPRCAVWSVQSTTLAGCTLVSDGSLGVWEIYALSPANWSALNRTRVTLNLTTEQTSRSMAPTEDAGDNGFPLWVLILLLCVIAILIAFAVTGYCCAQRKQHAQDTQLKSYVCDDAAQFLGLESPPPDPVELEVVH